MSVSRTIGPAAAWSGDHIQRADRWVRAHPRRGPDLRHQATGVTGTGFPYRHLQSPRPIIQLGGSMRWLNQKAHQLQ